jgi:hypothetical protein
VVYAPTSHYANTIRSDFFVKIFMFEQAKAGTLKLTITPITGDDGGARIIVLSTAMEAQGNHEFTMPALLSNAADLSEVVSVTAANPGNGVDIDHNSIFMVRLDYQKTDSTPKFGYMNTASGPGNGIVSVVTFDTETGAPTLHKPTAGSTVSAAITVNLQLPEAATSGTTKLTITPTGAGAATDSAAARVVTFATTATFAGTMEVTLALLSQTQPTTVTSVVPATDLVHNVVYTFELAYQDARGNAPASTTSASILYDVVTQQPTVHAPAGGSHIKPAFALSFTLPEAAKAGTVKLVLNPLAPPEVDHVTDPVGQRDVVFTFTAAQKYDVTMAKLSTAQTDVSGSVITSVTPATDLKNGAIYLLRISYEDASGNDAAFAASSLLRFDDVTLAPTLAAPSASTTVKQTFDVTFALPEAACAGCVSIVLTHTSGTADAHAAHTFVLKTAYEAQGTHTITALSSDLTSAHEAVLSRSPSGATALSHLGVYTVAVVYSDLATNAAATVQVTGVTVDRQTEVPVLNAPSASAFIATAFTITFTLPEKATAGTVQLVMTRTAGVEDPTAFRRLTFAAAFEAAGSHSVTVGQLLDAPSKAEIDAVSPTLPLAQPNLQDGALYTFRLEYGDEHGNPVVFVEVAGVVFAGSATLLPVVTAPLDGASVSSADTTVTFTLPESAQANKLAIRIKPTTLGTVADAAADRVVLLAEAAFPARTAHTITFPALSGAAAALGTVQSVTPATDLVPGAVYHFFVEYQDGVGNTVAVANRSAVTFTGTTTLPAQIVLPSASASVRNFFTVNFTLPVVAKPDSVQMTFTRTGGQALDPAAPRVVTFDTHVHTAGSHQVILQEFNYASAIEGVKSIAPATDLVDGAIYSIVFSYQDASSHPAFTVTIAGVNFASEYTMAMVVAKPAADSVMLTSFDVQVTVPELIKPGTAKMSFKRLDGQPDSFGDRELPFTTAINNGGTFSTTLSNFNSALADTSVLASVSPTNELVDGTLYQVGFEYQDGAANPVVKTIVRATYVGAATLPPAILYPLEPSSSIDVSPIIEAFTLQYTLLEAASDGTFTLEITPYVASGGPYYDAVASRLITFEGVANLRNPLGSITMAKLSSAATDVAVVKSVSPATDMVDGAYYDLKLSYKDRGNNPVASVTKQNILFCGAVTMTPNFTLPLGGGEPFPEIFEVAFDIPEIALPGSVKLLFTPLNHAVTNAITDAAGVRTLTLGLEFQRIGKHSFTMSKLSSAKLLSQVDDVQPPTDLVHDTHYDVRIQYADMGAGQASAGVTHADAVFDTQTEIPQVLSPKTASVLPADFNMTIRLPETAKPGTVKVEIVSENLGLIQDLTPLRTLTFASYITGAGTHTAMLNDLRYGRGNSTHITSVIPAMTLVDGSTYEFKLSYQDKAGNPVASGSTYSVMYGGVDTIPPIIYLPANASFVNSEFDVRWFFPERAGNGSVQILFIPTNKGVSTDLVLNRTITLGFDYQNPGYVGLRWMIFCTSSHTRIWW